MGNDRGTSGGGGLLSAVFWAATWGIGAAIGVALGGWLTVVSGSGAPGAETLDVFQDLIVLPGISGGAVMALHLTGHGLVAAWNRRRSS